VRRCRAGKTLLPVQRCGWALAPAHAPYPHPPERPVDGVRRPTSAARKDARTAAAQRVAPAAHAAAQYGAPEHAEQEQHAALQRGEGGGDPPLVEPRVEPERRAEPAREPRAGREPHGEPLPAPDDLPVCRAEPSPSPPPRRKMRST